MSDAFDAMFKSIVDERERGPFRITVLDNPTIAQLQAIPLDSDVILSDSTNFMSGPWKEESRDYWIGFVEASPCDHLHCYLAYLPPVPTPDSALTAEALAESVTAHLSGDVPLKDVRRLIREAVHQAREGMVYPPF